MEHLKGGAGQKENGRLIGAPGTLTNEAGGFQFLKPLFCRLRLVIKIQRRHVASRHDTALKEAPQKQDIPFLKLD